MKPLFDQQEPAFRVEHRFIYYWRGTGVPCRKRITKKTSNGSDSILMKTVAIIGGGPAGLMAAEVLCGHGLQVDVYDSMTSLGRKFSMAGKSGLNLTH